MAALGLSLGLPFSRQAVAAGGYPLSFATLGLTGVDGFVRDGVSSLFYINSDGPSGVSPSECASSGSDPVGWVEDLSGNNKHATMSSSPNKPVFYSAGGIKSFRGGLISAVRRMMENPAGLTTSAFTYYCVAKRFENSSTLFERGGYSSYVYTGAANGDVYFAGSTTLGGINIGTGAGIYTTRIVKSGTGANQTILAAKGSVSFTAMGTATGTDSSTYEFGTTIAPFIGDGHTEICFEFFAAADIGATARATIEQHILDTFGGWA